MERTFQLPVEGRHVDRDAPRSLTCEMGGLFMVLRARWTLGGGVDVGGGEDTDDGETGVLLAGPHTLILARPKTEEGDDGGSDLAA